MAIIGYGEDGLTYWALSTQLPVLLDRLGDHTDKKDCIIFYRASFGRNGGDRSPQFGEFDAILVTKKAVYLIECKWDNVANGFIENVVLEEVQTIRHRIFTWLRDRWHEWRRDNPANLNWAEFWDKKHGQFTTTFPNRPLARVSTLLARNLGHILHALEIAPIETKNVLLYFHRDHIRAPLGVVNTQHQPLDPAFVLVCLPYQPFGNSGYFELAP